MVAVAEEVNDEVRVELEPELDSEEEDVEEAEEEEEELSVVEDEEGSLPEEVDVEVEVLSDPSSVIVTFAVGEQAEAIARIKRAPNIPCRERFKLIAYPLK
jgi:hypothetical protein